jgi:proteasome accessory factor A
LAERLMGQETEYAFVGFNRAGKRVASPALADALMGSARSLLPHLPNGDGGGIFLASGGRFYIDVGTHPELTTPECPNPWDVVRYIKAGEFLLTKLGERMLDTQPQLGQVLFFRTNVDYSGSGNTWGCHESYAHRCQDLDLMRREIVPHLVSRIIYTGAGGFNPFSRGLTFMVSPRAATLEQEVSEETTQNRGIFNTRQEHHASEGYRRLHLVCGESLFSETAMFLKAGTTTLIVAMIENGVRPGKEVRLHNALEAIRRFANDPTCQTQVALQDGRLASAIQIQRHYLACAEQHRDASWMPSSAAAVCHLWREILELLAKGAPASVATKLDWAIKFAMFRDRLSRKGRSLEEMGRVPLLPDTAHKEISPLHGLTFVPSRHDVTEEQKQLQTLRQQLCEIDVRCGQLGSSGVLDALAAAGVLTHHVPGVDNFEHAMANPPALGRARLRGQCVLRLAGTNGRYDCHWTGVADHRKRQWLDLSDPFATQEKWVAQPLQSSSREMLPFTSLMEQARSHYDRGSYRDAYRFVCAVDMNICREELSPQEFRGFLRLKAWLESRLGWTTGAATLAELRTDARPDFQLVNDYVSIYRFQGLTAAPEVWEWIERGNTLLAQGAPHHPSTRVSFWSHQAYALKCVRRLSEAAELLERARAPEFRAAAEPRFFSRLLTELADIKRVQGNCVAATDLLAEATTIQTEHRYLGDLADFTFTCRARLGEREPEALDWLEKARDAQRRLHNRMGEARTLVLLARFARDTASASDLKQQVEHIRTDLPALQQCKLLETILARWTEWTGPDKQPDSHGDFFWGV